MPKLRRNASKAAKKKRVQEELHKFKAGTLKSSSGKKVTSRSQAIAIALSEAGSSNKGRSSAKSKKKSRKKA